MRYFLVSLCFLLVFQAAAKDIVRPQRTLFFSESDWQGVKQRVKGNSELVQFLNQYIFDQADQLLTEKPTERIILGRRMLHSSRKAERRIIFLAYAYRLSGKDQYLSRAIEEMEQVIAFESWNPSHFLDVAEMVTGLSVGMAWLEKDLPADVSNRVKKAIVEKGLRASFEGDPKDRHWVKAHNNWNQVCHGSLYLGAQVCKSDYPTISEKVIKRAEEYIQLPMSTYLPNGNYAEGPNYWNFGTIYNVLFLNAFEHINGQPYHCEGRKAFKKTGEFYLNAFSNSGMAFNYSDNPLNRTLAPSQFYLAKMTNQPSLLYGEMEWFDRHKQAKGLELVQENDDRFWPFILFWMEQSKVLTVPSQRMYHGKGKTPIVVYRSSWEEKNSVWLGIKAGSPKVSHAHMDAGSFIFEKDGIRWAHDLGRQQYHSLEKHGLKIWGKKQDSDRWKVFRLNNFAHNTLTIDGKLHKADGRADFSKVKENRKGLEASLDLSGFFVDQQVKVTRSFIVEDGQKALQVIDDFRGNDQAHQIEWAMVTDAEISFNGAEVILSKAGKSVRLTNNQQLFYRVSDLSKEGLAPYDEPNVGFKKITLTYALKEGEMLQLINSIQ
ncbi:heparinase II/III domain-containing protein [Persicobacter diffluens]|uniref:Heparinase II/III-like C-terminal domain-containing protein n=1 Tax=Persicobacter diffluens TaxID=981 RepID=A0AAN5APB2_9BACT|nr:hypothetical protein PEDI_47180 [Persicobacter diffluens]